MKVLLTSANGRTGRPMIAALAHKNISVRAFIRNADQADELKTLGASEIALGDMLDPESIDRAVAGCDKVIHIGPPMHADEVAITQNFVDAAIRSNMKHFVYYSVMHPVRREVRHHRFKLDAEENVIESGLPYTIVQPSRYMQHLELIWGKVIEEGIHAMPFSITKKFSLVDLLDLAEATATIASSDDHFFASYELAGPETLSQQDMSRIISEVLGKTVTAKAVSLTDLEARARTNGLTEDRINQMLIMNAHYDKHGFSGNPNVLRMILGRPPTSFRTYVDRLASRS